MVWGSITADSRRSATATNDDDGEHGDDDGSDDGGDDGDTPYVRTQCAMGLALSRSSMGAGEAGRRRRAEGEPEGWL